MMCLVERLAKVEDYDFDVHFMGESLRRIEAFRSEVRLRLQQGGRLWVWESPGWRELSGITGLLIERNGEIIKVWTTGRS